MKKCFLLLLIFFIYSCNIQKTKSDIIYFLPISIQEILYKEVQKRKKEDKDIYFVLDQYDKDTYIIYLSTISDASAKFWLKHSNRVIFLKGELIPMYFETDESFAFAEIGSEVLKKLGTDEGVRKVIHNRENAFQIKFKFSGKIIQ